MFNKLPILAVVLGFAAHAEDLPAWLREAMGRPLPVSKSSAVVLHEDAAITVAENGKLVTRTARAVRVLKREGASEAVARAIYTTDTGKVKEFRAWLIRPSGEVRKYGKNDVLDIALVNNDIYNEVRAKAISGVREADAGATFAYEFELEDSFGFTQFERTFQEDIPVLLARFTVGVPAGWSIEAKTYYSPSLKAAVTGNQHTWELQNVVALESEPFGPSVRSRAPRVAVSAVPPPNPSNAVRSFSKWADVASWLHDIAEPQMTPDNALLEKAQSLTRDAKTEWEKIAAIGRFVQRVQYVSIQTGIGRGGGYKPRAATLVLSRNYGDCKDKANLMRSMLKVVGVEGYPVVIYSGDRTYVHEDWPSPQQFNHCIIGARIKEDAQSPAVAVHPKLGRMVLFDPTDEHTPFGMLPSHEENSLALVVAPGTESLLRTPESKPDHNLTERAMNGSLDADGVLTATLRETSHGHAAAAWSRVQSDGSALRKELEGWLSGFMVGAQIVSITPRDKPDTGFEAKISVPGFAQPTGNLLMFRPAPVWMAPGLRFAARSRTQPLMLEPRAVNDSFSLTLPAGYKVDEAPQGWELKSEWGTFQTTCEVGEGKVEVRRSLKITGGMVPPDKYSAARDFLAKVAGSARMPVVLVKK